MRRILDSFQKCSKHISPKFAKLECLVTKSKIDKLETISGIVQIKLEYLRWIATGVCRAFLNRELQALVSVLGLTLAGCLNKYPRWEKLALSPYYFNFVIQTIGNSGCWFWNMFSQVDVLLTEAWLEAKTSVLPEYLRFQLETSKIKIARKLKQLDIQSHLRGLKTQASILLLYVTAVTKMNYGNYVGASVERDGWTCVRVRQ
jgi:hypothetical protein